MSPRRRRTRSPGTSSRAGTVVHAPSRLTRASSANCALSAAIAFPAWNSSQKPTIAFPTRRTVMIAKSSQCRTMAESNAAASIIQGMGPQK